MVIIISKGGNNAKKVEKSDIEKEDYVVHPSKTGHLS